MGSLNTEARSKFPRRPPQTLPPPPTSSHRVAGFLHTPCAIRWLFNPITSSLRLDIPSGNMLHCLKVPTGRRTKPAGNTKRWLAKGDTTASRGVPPGRPTLSTETRLPSHGPTLHLPKRHSFHLPQRQSGWQPRLPTGAEPNTSDSTMWRSSTTQHYSPTTSPSTFS